ncbi:MAG: 2-oxoacid:acceptor oxidoreductase subunit alpha, partial [Deltaproteobacteria bacterium]
RRSVEEALVGKRAVLVPELNMSQLRREVLRVNNGRTRVLGLDKIDGTMISPDEIIAGLREAK